MDRKKDLYYMSKAFDQAKIAYELDEVPVGAVIVLNGEIIGYGHNTVEKSNHAFEHAEINAIRMAGDRVGNWRLDGATMYVTLEPCAMCSGALILSRIKRLVIGAKDPKRGFAGSVLNLLDDDVFNHRLEVDIGVLEDSCLKIIQEFFKEKRNK